MNNTRVSKIKRRALTAIPIALTAGLFAGATTYALTEAAGASVAPIIYMQPGATSTSCTQSAPCGSLAAALSKSTQGAVIQASGGDYGDQTVPVLTRTQTAKSVTVTSAPGQVAIFGKTLLSQPQISFVNVSFDGPLRLNPSAQYTSLDRVHAFGPDATILVRSNYITIKNSLIENSIDHDGINIAGNPAVHDILIENNTVRDFASSGTKDAEHPDCIQIFDAHDITIQRNDLYDCYNSAITFSRGAGLGVSNVTIQSNFLQGCIASRQRCGDGGSSMDLRLAVTGTTVANNTFGAGSLRLPAQPGVSAPNNIISYLSVDPCTTAASNSLIGGYPAFACKQGVPGANQGNFGGTAIFVNAPQGDLHLAGAISVTSGAKFALSTQTPQGTDIDGNPFNRGAIGAAQFSQAAPTPPTPTAVQKVTSGATPTVATPTAASTPTSTPTPTIAASSSASPPAVPVAAASTPSTAAAGRPTSIKLSVSSTQLVATVSASPGAGVPSGYVVFSVNGSLVGQAILKSGTATLKYAINAGGSRLVEAAYLGSSTYALSTTTASS